MPSLCEILRAEPKVLCMLSRPFTEVYHQTLLVSYKMPAPWGLHLIQAVSFMRIGALPVLCHHCIFSIGHIVDTEKLKPNDCDNYWEGQIHFSEDKY